MLKTICFSEKDDQRRRSSDCIFIHCRNEYTNDGKSDKIEREIKDIKTNITQLSDKLDSIADVLGKLTESVQLTKTDDPKV